MAFPWSLGMFAIFIMPKDKGGLCLIDVSTQGNILAAKWVIRCLKGSSPWQVLMRYRLLFAPMLARSEGSLVFVISSIPLIIFKLQGLSSSKVFGLHGRRWQVWFVGRYLAVEQDGIWPKGLFGAGSRKVLVSLTCPIFRKEDLEKSTFSYGGIFGISVPVHGKIGELWLRNLLCPLGIVPPLWKSLRLFLRRIYLR